MSHARAAPPDSESARRAPIAGASSEPLPPPPLDTGFSIFSYGRPAFISIFNTLLGLLLACLGVAWAIKSYNYTEDSSERAIGLSQTANDYAKNGTELTLLSSLVQMCLDDNISVLSVNDDICREYISAMEQAIVTALTSLPGFESVVTVLPDTSTEGASVTTSATTTNNSSTSASTDTSIGTGTSSFSTRTGSATASASLPGGSAQSTGGGGADADAGGEGAGGGELGLGAILGIIAGVFFALMAILIAVYYVRRSQYKKRALAHAEKGAALDEPGGAVLSVR